MRLKASIATSTILVIGVSGCIGSEPPDESTTHQAVLTDCSAMPPMSALSSIPTIDRDKELIIKNTSVVDDACRTAWNASGCPTGSAGAWTFGQLLATMSGNSDVTSATARQFVRNWLKLWLSPQTNVNPDRPQTVAVRPLIGGVMLYRWLIASGCPSTPAQTTTDPNAWISALQACPLDLKQAPFRLLAISNRIDLDGRDYDGNGAPGELRLAFGLFNPATPAANSLNAEFILEYHFPNTLDTFSWASWLHNLSGSTAFDANYKSQLQNITDMVVGPNAQPGNPNTGSSLAQIRTLENVFDSAHQWEFRQFRLTCSGGSSCPLSEVPVDQTPPTTDNNTQALTTWLIANQDDISTSRHVVPTSILAASSLSPALPNSTVWNTTGDPINGYTLVRPSDRFFSFNIRHNFAFSTCNGCHYFETTNGPTKLFHINPRAPGAESAVSGFLAQTLDADPNHPGLPDPSNTLQVQDPNFELFDQLNQQPLFFEYNEIWRRACEVRRIFAGITTPITTPTGHAALANPPGDVPPNVPPEVCDPSCAMEKVCDLHGCVVTSVCDPQSCAVDRSTPL